MPEVTRHPLQTIDEVVLKRSGNKSAGVSLPLPPARPLDQRLVRTGVWVLLLAFAIAPVCFDGLHGQSDTFVYRYMTAAYFVSTAFCVMAGLQWRGERRRWYILAVAQALRIVVYFGASLSYWAPLSYGVRAWSGNVCVAAWNALMLPALLSTRIDRGRVLRVLDTSLVLVFAAVLMFSLGAGPLAGDSDQRIWIGIVALALLSVLALVARFAQAGAGTRHFTSVVSKTLWMDLLTSLVVNGIFYRWFPNTPNSIAAPISVLQCLLLWYLIVQGRVPGPITWFSLDRTAVDSLQPSVLALSTVVLTLFTLHVYWLVSGGLVIAVVLLYAVRTQMFYSRLFRERHMLRSQTEYLHELATRDPLTGIANRRWLEETMVQVLDDRSAYPCSLLMIDTDRFKQINDTRGHQAGDSVLCMIADVLQRETDGIPNVCVGRIGGDEFAVLLPRTKAHSATECAERIRNVVEDLGSSRGYGVTTSIGIATLTRPATRSELLQCADEALYRAKAAGRNAVRN